MPITSHNKDKAPVQLSLGNLLISTPEPTFTMKKISLSCKNRCKQKNLNLFAIVDNEDYFELIQYVWQLRKIRNCYYAYRSEWIGGKLVNISMHRQILGLKNRWEFGEHIDLNGLNNQRSNLRKATNSQNQMNRPSYFGSSIYKGVSWIKSQQKWVVKIRCGGKRFSVGSFDNEIDAAFAYDFCAYELHGEFALLNFRS